MPLRPGNSGPTGASSGGARSRRYRRGGDGGAAGHHVAQVAGPGLAGLLLLVTGPGGVLALDALTFVVSLLTLVREPAVVPVVRRRLHVEVVEGLAASRAVRPSPACWRWPRRSSCSWWRPSRCCCRWSCATGERQPRRTGWSSRSVSVGGVLGALLPTRWSPQRPSRPCCAPSPTGTGLHAHAGLARAVRQHQPADSRRRLVAAAPRPLHAAVGGRDPDRSRPARDVGVRAGRSPVEEADRSVLVPVERAASG